MQSVEVKGLFGQLLFGSLEEVEDNKCVVTYSNDVNKTEVIEMNHVRFSVEKIIPQNLTVGMAVEAFIEPNETDGLGWSMEDTLDSPRTISQTVDSITVGAWWRCIIKCHNVDNCAVNLLPIVEENANEAVNNLREALASNLQIVEKNKIRLPTNQPFGIDLNALHKLNVPLPPDLQRFGSAACLHKKMIRRVNGPAIVMVERIPIQENGSQQSENNSEGKPADDTPTRRYNSSLLFYSPDEKILERIKLLLDDHWANIRQKAAILRQKQNAIGYTPHSRATNKMGIANIPDHLKDCPVIERFLTPSSLIRFCIGPQGSNIKKARDIPDVKEIQVSDPCQYDYLMNNDPSGQVVIYALTREAAANARDQLEYVRLRFAFPEQLTGRLIGKQTNNIHSVINKSGVLNINFFNPGDPESENLVNSRAIYVHVNDGLLETHTEPVRDIKYASFIIVGDKESVLRAELLLTAQIDNFSEVNKLELDKAQLFSHRQLNNQSVQQSKGAINHQKGPPSPLSPNAPPLAGASNNQERTSAKQRLGPRSSQRHKQPPPQLQQQQQQQQQLGQGDHLAEHFGRMNFSDNGGGGRGNHQNDQSRNLPRSGRGGSGGGGGGAPRDPVQQQHGQRNGR